MSKLFKEPLVHFLIGALCIFAYFWANGDSRDPLSYEINITRSDIDRIATDTIRTTQRLPTHDELSALIDQNIKEEIYYREALRLGLDDGDAIIRRRLSNKMRSLNSAKIDDPSDAQLQKWIKDNPSKYSISNQYAFQQIYIGRNTDTEKQKQWLGELQTGNITADSIRQPLSLDAQQALTDTQTIERLFGSKFTQQLTKLESQKWQGPIESGLGLHFIFIDEIETGQPPSLDTIRQKVSNDWRVNQITKREDAAYEELSKQYNIQIADIK